MPRPEPLAFVKMPGRPKIERRREQGEGPKGTKLSRVGIKMRCRLCHKSDHNARRCPKNPEASRKANAHIKRAKTRKREDAELGSTCVITNEQAGNRNVRVKRTAKSERVTFIFLMYLFYTFIK